MKKLIALLITISLLLFTASVVIAADAAITITADKDEATLEDYITLSVSVEGASGEPSLPKLPDFEITSRGSSSRVQIINGQMSSSVDYSYVLYPKKEGAFTIGPATLSYKSATLTSNTIKITIRKTEARPGEAQDKDVFVTAEVDNKSPYLNEQIVYTLKFFHRVKVANARLTESPSFDGFITESLGKEKEYQTTINGQQFMVTEVRQALFPLKAGTLTISPSTLHCDVVVKKQQRGRGFSNDPFFDDSFFGFSRTEPKILRTAPMDITVRPLPEEGRPRDFSNLVGEFQAAAELTKNKLEVGESTTLTLTLTGTGNLKGSPGIKLENPDGFKVYDDKPSFEPQVSGSQIGGKLVIKKALVPLKEGILQVPPVALSYFNPRSGKYETARTGTHLLEVIPGKDKEKLPVAEAEKPKSTKQEIKILGRDILPIHTSVDVLNPVNSHPLSWVAMLLFFLPVMGFTAALLIKQRKELYDSDRGFARSRTAYKNFTRKLPPVKKSLNHDDSLFYRDAAKAIKDFIGDKLNITGSALTPGEFESKLSEARVDGTTIQELKKVIEMLETGQFAFKKYSREEREAMLNSMKQVAREINKKIK